MPIVEYVVVSPPIDDLIQAVLRAVECDNPAEVTLETLDVDAPWAHRREVSFRLRQFLRLDDGWLRVAGYSGTFGQPSWLSITLRLWAGPRASGPQADEGLGASSKAETKEPELPATASIVS